MMQEINQIINNACETSQKKGKDKREEAGEETTSSNTRIR
jgi:hypothetical protein